MNIDTNAAGQPAGAGTLYASISQIAAMASITELAMGYWRAHDAVENAKYAYYAEIRRYEAERGRLNKSVLRDDPAHRPVREFTAAKYKALQRAKRQEYAAKVKLRKACAGLARTSASIIAVERGAK